MAPLLIAVAERGGVVGGICAGTLALARAGLFRDKTHTSNGRDWILGHVPDYPGAERYRDVPHAVADGRLISAPGSAPGTFAIAFLEALYPERKEQIATDAHDVRRRVPRGKRERGRRRQPGSLASI